MVELSNIIFLGWTLEAVIKLLFQHPLIHLKRCETPFSSFLELLNIFRKERGLFPNDGHKITEVLRFIEDYCRDCLFTVLTVPLCRTADNEMTGGQYWDSVCPAECIIPSSLSPHTGLTTASTLPPQSIWLTNVSLEHFQEDLCPILRYRVEEVFPLLSASFYQR